MRFAVKSPDLRVARFFRVSFYNRVFPETAVGRSLNFDGRWGIANVLAINFDLGTWGLGDYLDFLPGPYGVGVRCAPRAERPNRQDHGGKKGARKWQDPMHEIWLIKK